MSTKSTTTTGENSAKRKNGAVESDAPSKKSKKEKHNPSSANAKNSESKNDKDGFSMLKLEDIKSQIELLCKKVPAIPEGNFILPNDTTTETETGSEPLIDEKATRQWAEQLQVVLEEFNLYICCVGTATYKWGTERSGAGDQNLNLLLTEMSSSQEQISTAVTPRITNLLAPVVDMVIEKTVTYKEERTIRSNTDNDSSTPTMTEVKENHFTRKVVDPAFLSLCHKILARNAPMLRRVVLSNFHKILAAIQDFLKAQKNDTQHSRSFPY